jgi:peroxin-10
MTQSTQAPQFPFASSPDVIRANQKDAYFQAVLLEQLSDILRKVYGARFTHNYTSEIRTFADLLYHGLTTLLGNRTLGEEYCDIVQVEDDSRKLPSLARRSGYILSTILLPYSLNRALPAFRRRLRAQLESSLRRSGKQPASSKVTTWIRALQSYFLANLDTITSPSPIYAVSLAIFYFSGAYYHLGKRLWGLRYIFTRRVDPSEQRAGYEVLGVLLVLQLGVQTYMHMHSTVTQGPTIANIGSLAGGNVVLSHGVEVSLDPQAYSSNNALLFETDGGQQVPTEEEKAGLQKMTHTPILAGPRYDFRTDHTVMQWMSSKQQRKCTLCLEELKDPSVTTCGHVFCWSCIGDWLRERPECPLCRSQALIQHVLPLRG